MKLFFVAILAAVLFGTAAFLYLDHSSGGLIRLAAKRALFGNAGSPTRIEVNGVELYYETHGRDRTGGPVLILHGDFAYIETMPPCGFAAAARTRKPGPSSRLRSGG